MKRLLATLAAAFGLLLGGTAQAAPIIIDTFQLGLAPTTAVTSFGAPASSSSQSGASILSGLGSRVVTALLTAGGGNALAQINTVTNTGIAATAGAGDAGTITYTYTFNSPINLNSATGVDLLIATDDGAGGASGGIARVLLNNGSGFNLVSPSQQTNTTNAAITNNPLFFPFGGTARNSVTQLQIQFDLVNGRDLTFGGSSQFFIRNGGGGDIIPEPATLAVCGLFGLAGLVTARRKTKKA